MIKRRPVKKVKLKNLEFGSDTIYIQSMLNMPAEDIIGNVQQAIELEKAGCQIIRTAIPNQQSVHQIEAIKKEISIPLVADIHFDYRLALSAVDAGIDKIRINPGNIGSEQRVKQVADHCRIAGVPIRVGVNSGSLESNILKKYGRACPEALVESALSHVSLLEKYDFEDIVISIKSSDVHTMIRAYELLALSCDYPLHLGVTEAGTDRIGLIKSAIGIGSLLAKGVGDTIRVSLTSNPVNEIYAAHDILKALGLKKDSVTLVSCPTCGRTKIDLIGLANIIESAISHIQKPIKVAVMGCVVNGPGEAKDADIGIAGGDGCAVLFKKGQVIRKINEDEIISVLLEEIEKF